MQIITKWAIPYYYIQNNSDIEQTYNNHIKMPE